MGADANYRRVAHVISHEYSHNWSGNRVTVKNWFELALKEAFTEMRSVFCMEWMFGEAMVRPGEILALRNHQFPEDASPKAHPISVDSYYQAGELYDGTTYTKGAEVFRMLRTIINAADGEDGFKKAQNAYFEKYDGQAVTVRDLLPVLQENSSVSLVQFERWFTQPGTPEVTVNAQYDADSQKSSVTLRQSCPHPKTQVEQEPFDIPFSVELLSKDGKVLVATHLVHLKDREMTLTFDGVAEEPIPVFQHGMTAPIKLRFEQTDDVLMTIVAHEADPIAQWDAGQTFILRVLRNLFESGEGVPASVVNTFKTTLMSESQSPLSKAHLLKLPGARAIVADHKTFDFVKAERVRKLLKDTLGRELEDVFVSLRSTHAEPASYDPLSDEFGNEMAVRKLRNNALDFLVATGKQQYLDEALAQFQNADNYNNTYAALDILADLTDDASKAAMSQFHQTWKGDVTMMPKWLQLMTFAPHATPETLKQVMKAEGYQADNANHMRAVYRCFASNLDRYHDVEGKGYKTLTDAIIELQLINPYVAANQIAKTAFTDYGRLSEKQNELMKVQLVRLTANGLDERIVSLATSILGK